MPYNTQEKTMSSVKQNGMAPGEFQQKLYQKNSKYTSNEIFEDEHLAAQRDRILRRLEIMREQRDTPHRNFDGMTFLQDYQSNKDAALTYLTPKANKRDVRVNTATTEKKLDVFVNELITSNIQAEIRAHEAISDTEIEYLGPTLTQAVERTNEIEHENDILEEMYRELISQRALFVQEVVVDKVIGTFKKFKVKRLEKRMVPGVDVYLGDLTISASKFHEQPDVAVYKEVSYETARTMFGDNPNFKYVKKGGRLNKSLEFAGDVLNQAIYSEWRMNTVQENNVDIVAYYNYPNQEYQLYVGGVPMYSATEPLPYKWEGYDISMVVVKPITNFAYGKPPVASAKPLQGLENETLRNFIYKTRQSLTPPIGTTGKRIYGPDIWHPGSISQGVTKNSFSRLIDHEGVTNSEMQMYGLINQIVEEFVGISKETQGLSSQGTKTATETLEQIKRSLKNMAYVIVAAERLRTTTTEKRLYSILTRYMEPVGKMVDPFNNQDIVDKYYGFTIRNANLGNGVKGTKRIMVMDRNLTQNEREDLYQLEQQNKKMGTPMKVSIINRQALMNLPLFFYVTAIQKEKPGSAVDRLMNNEKINQVAGVEKLSQGQVRVNWNNLSESIALSWNDRDLFETTPPQGGLGQGPATPESPKTARDLQALQKGLSELESISKTGVGAQLNEANAAQVRQPTAEQAAMSGQQ